MAAHQEGTGYHVIVAVGTEGQLAPLLGVGCALAAARDGRVTVVSVTPSGQRPAWLDVPETCGGVPVGVLVVAGRDPGTEILAVARQDPPDLILVGWSGARGRGQYLLGTTLDPVVQHSTCDVAVVRAEARTGSLDQGPGAVERVLVPTAGGPNAELAIDLALTLSAEAQITALSVAREAQGEVAQTLRREWLEETLKPWAGEPRVQGKVVSSSSPIKGILAEAAKGYDLVMIGASHESYLDRVLFGNIPQTIAARSPAPSIVVKRHVRRMVMGTWLRRAAWQLFSVLPSLELREQIEVYKAVREGAQPKVDFYVMMALSAAIATFGLLENSPAVIIGAMLVAPLMAAIFGLSLGMVRGDLRLVQRAASATMRGGALGIVVAVLLTLIIPERALPHEVIIRAQPSLLDLGVALASGAAGAYALCRKEVSAALPGVAIAAALVPPLATVGIGLARWDGQIAGGAMLLFIANLAAITGSGGLIFLWLGFRPLPGKKSRRRVFRGGVLGTIVLLGSVTVLLGILTVDSLHDSALNRQVEAALKAEIGDMEGVGWDGEWEMEELEGGTLGLDVWVRSRRNVGYGEVLDLQEKLASRLNRPVALVLSVIPSTQLDPLVPPTPTPTSPPGSTATLTASPTATPTSTSTPTPTHTPTLTPTPTSTPTNIPTHTPTPTPTFSPTSTPTFTPTPTPTPVLAQVGGTGGQGVWMYQQPGLGEGKIGALRDGTVLTVSGGPLEADGYTWISVIDPRGRLGWIPERYLVYLAHPPG